MGNDWLPYLSFPLSVVNRKNRGYGWILDMHPAHHIHMQNKISNTRAREEHLLTQGVGLHPPVQAAIECVCVCCHPIYSGRQTCGRTAGVTQEEGHTGFSHLPSVMLALIFIARRVQPSLSLVDREVEVCVPMN